MSMITTNMSDSMSTSSVSDSYTTVLTSDITVNGQDEDNSTVSEGRVRCMNVIERSEDFETWKSDGTTRYVSSNFLVKDPVDEKLTLADHATDAIVWNIVHIEKNEVFPTDAPPSHLRLNALDWLNRFKKYLNNVFQYEFKALYCRIGNQDNWVSIRQDGLSFQSYRDLCKKTKEVVGEQVSLENM